MFTLLVLISFSAIPRDRLDQGDAKTRMEHRLKGGLVALHFYEGMAERDVLWLLDAAVNTPVHDIVRFPGKAAAKSYDNRGKRLFYRELGVTVWFRYPPVKPPVGPTLWGTDYRWPSPGDELMGLPSRLVLADAEWCGVLHFRRRP